MVRPAPPVRKAMAVVDAGGLREAAPRVVNRVAGVSVSLGRHGVDTMAREDVAEVLPAGALAFRLLPLAEARRLAAPAEDGDEAAGGGPGEAGGERDGDGPGRGAGGLGWLSPDLFTAIVERRLTGAVRQAAGPVRVPTPLDAVICAELIDGLCAAEGVGGPTRLVTAGHLPEPDLSVVLADIPYRVLRLTLAIARGGGRGGEIGLVLPDPPRDRAEDGVALAAPGAKRPELLACRADLSAVMPPVVLPWARLTALTPGDLIELPGDALGGIRVEGIDGAGVARGRLGRLDAQRAVRLEAMLDAPAAPPAAGARDPGSADAPDEDADALGDALDGLAPGRVEARAPDGLIGGPPDADVVEEAPDP